MSIMPSGKIYSTPCFNFLKCTLQDTASVIGMTFLAQGILNLTLYIINFDFYFSHVIDFGKNYHIVDGVINFVIALKCSIIISLGKCFMYGRAFLGSFFGRISY